MRWLYNIFLGLISLGFFALIAGVGLLTFVIAYYSRGLPDHLELKNYEPPIVTRIYGGDGRLMAEYAQEKRIFIPYAFIPETVIHAFVSAEDQNFFGHKGVDMLAIARAAVTNIKNMGTSRRPVGASTITQQVAKNFLLTNEVSIERKIREAILAMRLEKALSKERLLELYLNEIYLGQRSYGVAAAALTYFNKSLDDLTIAEAAYLAALPKAPNNYHPVRHRKRALARRNWVVDRMTEDEFISTGQAALAKAAPLDIRRRGDDGKIEAPFFAEEVRRELEQTYTADTLYTGGMAVRTSLDPRLQEIAVQALRSGLTNYDKRHGWRGPVARLELLDGWGGRLAALGRPDGLLENWRLGVVLEARRDQAEIGFADKSRGYITLAGVKWARQCLEECYALGPVVKTVDQVLNVGDVVAVERAADGKNNDSGNDGENKAENENEKEIYDGDEAYILRQIPAIQGAIVALDPHTGRILAMQGGWRHGASVFNRATQARRQPGSAFKPFVYLAALDKGFTPATLVLDAPFVIEQTPGDYWRPSNYSNEFYGPTPIRVGVEKSRNLMTVRLADHVGMEAVIGYAARFGIADGMKPFLSYALGAGETTLLRLTSAYAMLVNGGREVAPTLIDRIQDRYGKTIFSHDERPCANCGDLILWEGQEVPPIPDTRAQIADERTAYQIVSILEGVVKRGTARRLASLGHPLAGKTGTTNESKDTWFIGFSPDLVVGVFAGFDDPASLGKKETGSSVAAPIFKAFMKEALAGKPPTPFRVPAGVRHVRINAETGRAAQPGDKKVIWEAFVSGTEPNLDDYVLDTNVISGGGQVESYSDPYGYEQFGYGDYGYRNGGNNNISSAYQRQQIQGNGEGPRTAPVGGGPDKDPALTGTGGLY